MNRPLSPTAALGVGLATYVMWGFFPLYFHALAPAGALEVIAHRATWSLVAALALLVVTGQAATLRSLDAASVTRLGLAGVLIIANWTSYVYAVQTGRTLDAALGYFINPLLTVALGRIVLHERLTRLQGVALGLGALAVAILATGLSEIPWLALIMPTSFAAYSLVKKTVAQRVSPLTGMVVETAWVAPVLAGYLGYLLIRNEASVQTVPAASLLPHAALLIGAGPITLLPLLTLATASRTLSLTVLGLLQYLSPVLQMTIAVAVFGEVVEPARWIGSAFVWVGLLVLVIDGVRTLRARRRPRPLHPG